MKPEKPLFRSTCGIAAPGLARTDHMTAAEVRRVLGGRLQVAMALASTAMMARSNREVTVAVVADQPTATGWRYAAVEQSLTHRQVIAEGDEDEATAGAIAHMARNHDISIEFLRSCVETPEISRAFTRGVHMAMELLGLYADGAGIAPTTSDQLARDICEGLRVPRGRDLRRTLIERGAAEEDASAAASIHSQLIARGHPGWTLHEAEQCLRGGPDARAGLDDLEARLGIDVRDMRVAITFIGREVSDARLAEVCVDRRLDIGLAESGRWQWTDATGRSSNLDFDTEREAAIAALEEAFASDWLDHGDRDLGLLDFIGEQSSPGLRL